MELSGCSIRDPKVAAVLASLHARADRADETEMERALRLEKERGRAGVKERADLFENVYMPVSPDAGRFLYMLAVTRGARNIVEFGTSFGISAIYLAAALCDAGGGRLITSELSAHKIECARENVAKAGLSACVEFREGDALETLKTVGHGIDFLFLDGWKDLYLPVLRLVEPRLVPGAVVVADDLDIAPEALKPYLEYVRAPESGYISVTAPIGDAMEWSIREKPSS